MKTVLDLTLLHETSRASFDRAVRREENRKNRKISKAEQRARAKRILGGLQKRCMTIARRHGRRIDVMRLYPGADFDTANGYTAPNHANLTGAAKLVYDALRVQRFGNPCLSLDFNKKYDPVLAGPDPFIYGTSRPAVKHAMERNVVQAFYLTVHW